MDTVPAVEDIPFGEGGHGFGFQAGQVGHIVATAETFLKNCVAQKLSRGMGHVTRDTVRRTSASIMGNGPRHS